MDILVAHLGAGNHNPASSSKYKTLLKRSLNHNDIIEAARVVEQSELTNTGYGSSLNLLGCVECDASFIEATEKVRIGSLVGVDCSYPIKEVFRTLDYVNELYQSDDKHDLTAPVMLNYQRVKDLIPKNPDELSPNQLISKRQQRIYDIYKDKVLGGRIEELKHQITDTIGLIRIVECKTTLATSSGGNFFKLPGRIGCAGIIGAAIDFKRIEGYEISCMCSGNGEQIIRSKLSWEIVNNISKVPEEEYASYFKQLVGSIYCGFIVVIKSKSTSHLLYGHTTESFHFGFRVGENTRVILSHSEKEGFTFGEYKLL
ncbi:uncharacterized protein SPAPADRAFT_48528 [Spathaspora passalidarum NRRL Y-27907]|uniref:Uncharacterized protein n=1 Tax=Spathaspora passalidarum (strain NRRL Y-27907 / 11-Y1) TaxID=619300 RepID=G3AE11_SPAPN|nr:uncharacterized protein SPAPADRAFT_48528 [Spathaspora passalidarum NRRL Y-27907]EGW35545.1 hypothetical protein SPAPADRAFT_48528 [Spathaspora passalidarum NRRL Y-27907]